MSSTYTSLANVIVPEIFVPYVIERTAAKSKILQSGIAVANPKLNELVTRGGTTMKMPFWQDLQGRSQLWTEGSDIEVRNITAEADIAALLLRANAWGATDMSGALAGDDPMKAIGELVSDYWARDEQTTLLYILKGVFASSSMADHILDKSTAAGTAANIDGNMVLDAKQLMGDAADKLTAIAMHSAVFTSLQKQNLITTVMEVGPSGSQIAIPTYLGYRVVVDDSMPTATTISTAGVYTLTISTAATAGDKISINGTEYTFVANDSTATGNVIKVGADGTAAQQAANIAALTVSGFTLANTAGQATVTFTNSSSTVASTMPAISVTKVATTGTLVAAIANTTPEVKSVVYTTYLFARGVIGRGEGTPVSFVPVETDRNSLGSKDVLIHRRAFVMHPYGIKWAGSSALETPSDDELATGSNWVRVYESKNIGIVAIKHKIA